MSGVTPAAVLAFWQQAGPARWFAKDDAFDAAIAAQFTAAHHMAARGELDRWAQDWQGALALLILLDQFPRNLFRQSPHAFATDGLAIAHARRAVDAGLDQQAPAELRVFFYMPFEHSEALADQDRCVALCRTLDAASGSEWSKWAELHREIVARFGRFPHRNPMLGRDMTAEEQAYIAGGGFTG